MIVLEEMTNVPSGEGYVQWLQHIAYNEYSRGDSVVVISEVSTRMGDISAG